MSSTKLTNSYVHACNSQTSLIFGQLADKYENKTCPELVRNLLPNLSCFVPRYIHKNIRAKKETIQSCSDTSFKTKLAWSLSKTCPELVWSLLPNLSGSVPSYKHKEYPRINSKDPLQNLWFITVILEHTLQPQHTTSYHTKETNKMSASDDTSSAAFIAAAINNSKDDGQEQVSDVVDDTTNDNNDNVSGNDASNNKDKETDADVFFFATREIMKWLNKKKGMAAMEDRQFRSFFGTRNDFVLKVWGMLGEGSLRPENSKPKHLLWAL
jgi:hypothetical protein